MMKLQSWLNGLMR